jgi:hypothetical protein
MRIVFLLLAWIVAIGSGSALGAPMIGGCPVLPVDNVWNARVDTLPVHPNSTSYVANLATAGDGATRSLHMDFGSGLYPDPPDPDAAPIGIPFITVPGTQPKVPIVFDVDDESDAGPYPVPPSAPIEGVGPPDIDGDRHVLVIDTGNCVLYELYYAFPQLGGASWTASSGAVYDLRSNALRPQTWTSADAAGLPIFPGLARYDEVAAGAIQHALRFTASRTQRAFVWPARHYASSVTDAGVPPMGARFRLKSTVNISGFSPQPRAIAQAMQTYGLILADNGSPWFVSGAPDERWDNDALHELDVLKGSDFEAVDESSLTVNVDSGQVAGACTAGDDDNDGMPNCVELAEGRNPLVKDNDVFGNARLFVMQQYRDFLNREGDSGGIGYWTNLITTGIATRAQTAEYFFNSQEFQTTVSPVVRLYFAYFRRIPDYAGLVFWIDYVRSGHSFSEVSNFFATSPEFVSTYGSLDNGQFVSLLYQNVLGRTADAGGLAFWTGQLNNAAMTRGQVMLSFSESAEFVSGSRNSVYVTMMYVGMLRRSPDQGGFDFWVGYMAGNSGLALINGFLASPEYHGRFLP